MTSQEFIRLTKIFQSTGDAFPYLIDLLKRLRTIQIQLTSTIFKMSESALNSHAATIAHSELRGVLTETAELVRSNFTTRGVWAGTEDLRRRIDLFRSANISNELGGQMSEQLNLFSDAYEAFVKSYSTEHCFALIDAANTLFHSLSTLELTATLAERALAVKFELSEGESELELHFDSNPSAIELAAKFSALVEFYDELCALLSISTATHPLRIAKVESGSWFAKVIGALPAIALMTRLIESAAHYLYRNFTTEGQISSLPRSADALERILDLKGRLEEQGIPTTGMSENIEKSAVLLSQKLNTLLGGEPRVIVNAVEISFGEKQSQQRLENSSPSDLRLRDKSIEESGDPSSSKKKRSRRSKRDSK